MGKTRVCEQFGLFLRRDRGVEIIVNPKVACFHGREQGIAQNALIQSEAMIFNNPQRRLSGSRSHIGQNGSHSYTPSMRSIILTMVFLVCGLGCAMPAPVTDDPFAVTPMDFSLDVTILLGESAPSGSEVHLRPSRCVLYADGSLHYGEGEDLGVDQLPPLVRQLNRRQVAGVWSLAQQLGFADFDNGSEPVNFSLIQAGPDEIVDLIMFTGDGRRWEFVRRSSLENPDQASMQLVRLLAQLAWAEDTRLEYIAAPPFRYDFGPDPYSMYRK